MTLPTLDYATPERKPNVFLRVLTFTKPWFCVFATVPLATLAATYLRLFPFAHAFPATLTVLAIAVAFWPALLVEHVIRSRPPPASLLGRVSAVYVLLTLALFIAILPGGRGEFLGALMLYTFVLLFIFVWLAGSFRHAGLVSRSALIAIVVPMLISLPLAQQCPHSTSVIFFGIPLYVSGQPCKNQQTYARWWTLLQRGESNVPVIQIGRSISKTSVASM